jgi:hypothetical protein
MLRRKIYLHNCTDPLSVHNTRFVRTIKKEHLKHHSRSFLSVAFSATASSAIP